MTDQEYINEFSFRLRKRMRNLGMTQKELAERAGLTESAVSNYINGKRLPSLNVLHRLLNVLELKGKSDWLINF